MHGGRPSLASQKLLKLNLTILQAAAFTFAKHGGRYIKLGVAMQQGSGREPVEDDRKCLTASCQQLTSQDQHDQSI